MKKIPGIQPSMKLIKPLFALMMLVNASQVLALQVLDASQAGQILHARISLDDMTRLAIQDGRISNMHFPEGSLTVVKDEEQGFVVIRARDDKPVSLILTSSSGQTHSVFLTPAAIGMETILIKEKKTLGLNGSTRIPGSTASRQDPQSSAVKQLVLSMARDEKENSNFMVEAVNKDFDLWQETNFHAIDTFTSENMVGHRYMLTNVSDRQMRLGEQEFFKHGVIAVAIDRHVLEPGEQTFVFVVMVRNDG
jgi:conjugal transfer pilus assembly protein TraK